MRALAELGKERDRLSSRIADLLDVAWFRGRAASAEEVREYTEDARRIIERAEDLSTHR
jgi:hypothetical protein